MLEDFVVHLKNAVDDYLEMCAEQKIKPEIPFKGSLNVRLGSDLHRRVALAATKKHSSVNKYIADALSAAVNQN